MPARGTHQARTPSIRKKRPAHVNHVPGVSVSAMPAAVPGAGTAFRKSQGAGAAPLASPHRPWPTTGRLPRPDAFRAPGA